MILLNFYVLTLMLETVNVHRTATSASETLLPMLTFSIHIWPRLRDRQPLYDFDIQKQAACHFTWNRVYRSF